MDTKFKVLVNRFGAARLGIDDLFELMDPLLDRADTLLEILRKSVYTKKMQEASRECSTLFRGLHDATYALRVLTADKQKEAYENLFNLLARYKSSILDAGYSEESSAAYNLVQDLRLSKYSTYATLLGLNKWVDFIEEAADKFRDLHEKRTQEQVDKPKERLSNVRSQVDELYRGMTDRIYSKLLADGLGGDVVVEPDDLKTGLYDDTLPEYLRGNVTYNFVIAWNEVVKEYHKLLAKRAAAGRNAKDKNPELPETDVPEDDSTEEDYE
jgi:hypothetical protein